MKYLLILTLFSIGLTLVLADYGPCEQDPLAKYDGPWPDPDSCQHYWWCRCGYGERKSCPSDQYYDPKEQICNYKKYVNCTDTAPTPPTPEPTPTTVTPWPTPTTVTPWTTPPTWSPSTSSTTLSPNSTTPETHPTPPTASPPTPETAPTPPPTAPTATPPPSSNKCPDDEIVNLPIEGDCTKYILCVQGEEYIVSCGEGTEFDEETRKCKLSEDAECNACPLEDPQPPTPPVCVPDKKDPSKYFLCRNREQIPMQCDEKLRFDPVTQTCRPSEESRYGTTPGSW